MNLVEVQRGMLLDAPTATAWASLVAAVHDEHGVVLTITSPGGAWRSEQMVLDMWNNPAKYGATKGVAKPRSLGGPGSVHENGRCVDIWNHSAVPRTSLVQLARARGFTFTIAKEPWHIQHDGSGGGGAGGSGSPTRRKRRTMLLFHSNDPSAPNGLKYHIITSDGREAAFTGEQSFANGVAGQLGPSVPADRAFLEAIKKQFRDSGPASTSATVAVTPSMESLVTELRSIGEKVDALPAEIDRYADGRKQAS